MNKFSVLMFCLLAAAAVLVSCHTENKPPPPGRASANRLEIPNLYGNPVTEMIWSKSVRDSFKVFSSVNQSYHRDSAERYPLIIVLDANAYFEPFLAELKLGTLTQNYTASIVVGIGYRDFWTLDSLRDRDYTFPVAAARDSFKVSGGGQNFKKFIDAELLPHLQEKYRIDSSHITLAGHSLGGFFALYYLFSSSHGHHSISNFIAASPSLGYANGYLLQLEKQTRLDDRFDFKLYVSVGSREQDPTEKENLFLLFARNMNARAYKGARMKFEEYSNFDHMDAAMPGLMKGLIFCSE